MVVITNSSHMLLDIWGGNRYSDMMYVSVNGSYHEIRIIGKHVGFPEEISKVSLC